MVGQSLSAGERKPYYLNPSNTKLNQLNIGVVGDLGTGKTQLTKALIYQFTRRAAGNRGHAPKFLILDYKRDYTKPDFVDAVGARVVSPHRIPLNVFDLPAARDHLPDRASRSRQVPERRPAEDIRRHRSSAAEPPEDGHDCGPTRPRPTAHPH